MCIRDRYLILFAPHAFEPQRQLSSSKPPSPLVFLLISTHLDVYKRQDLRGQPESQELLVPQALAELQDLPELLDQLDLSDLPVLLDQLDLPVPQDQPDL